MKITHISPKKYHPCLWRSIRLQKDEHDITFVVLNLDSDHGCKITKRYSEGRIDFVEISARRIVDFAYDTELRNLIDHLLKEKKPDLIHVHLFSGVTLAPILNAASSLDIKKIITLHDHSLACLNGIFHNGEKNCPVESVLDCACNTTKRLADQNNKSLSEYNKIRKIRLDAILDACDKIICCSRDQKSRHIKMFKRENKFETIYYGVDLPRVSRLLKKENDKKTFGYLGILHHTKGIPVILDALSVLKARLSKFKLLIGIPKDSLIFDDGEYFKKLSAFSNVKILQSIKYHELYKEFFSHIDYLIIPSLWNETGPMTLFESFFYKVPVIISNQKSLIEKIKGNMSSRIFKNAPELAKIMAGIIEGKIKKEQKDIFDVKENKKYTTELVSIYQKITHAPAKTLLLRFGYVCDNNCLFCVTGNNTPRAFAKSDMLKKYLQHFRHDHEKVIFTGGEPTLHPDFFHLLETAYRLGYRTTVQTNAKIFSKKEFCEKIKYYNLDINTHIQSHRPKIHNSITRSPGSFEQTVSAIKNLRNYRRCLTVKIMVTKLNYKEILKTVKFISALPIDNIWIVFLTPDGFSKSYFDYIVPTYKETSRYIKEAASWIKHNTKLGLTIEGMPYCRLNGDLHRHMMEKPEKDEPGMYCAYPTEGKNDEYYAKQERIKQKIMLPQCAICKKEYICEGIYKEYIEKRGTQGFKPIR